MDAKIEEWNKIIGIFDGWYQKDLPKNGDINWFHPKYSTKITDTLSIPSKPSNFKYHSSWDWLMPVAKKINNLSPIEGKFKEMEEWWDLIDNSVTQNYEIAEAYPFIVQFLQWYNNQKQITKPPIT